MEHDTVALGAEQKNNFIEYFTNMNGQNLGAGYKTAVELTEYTPNALKKHWNGHKKGLSINISVEIGNKKNLLHSIKVWDEGFDTGIAMGALHWARIMKGAFPYASESITAEDVELTIKAVKDDTIEMARALYQKNNASIEFKIKGL